jgi:methylphosphotriester-DNA--protein-cysteine methyltransferase
LNEWVKGCVVANRKTKIYHLPDHRGYARAKESKNAVFFRTARDAEKAGYRVAKR